MINSSPLDPQFFNWKSGQEWHFKFTWVFFFLSSRDCNVWKFSQNTLIPFHFEANCWTLRKVSDITNTDNYPSLFLKEQPNGAYTQFENKCHPENEDCASFAPLSLLFSVNKQRTISDKHALSYMEMRCFKTISFQRRTASLLLLTAFYLL